MVIILSYSFVKNVKILPPRMEASPSRLPTCAISFDSCSTSPLEIFATATGWAGQIGRSVANGSPPVRHFFEKRFVA